jgi:hypothetical protein
MGYRLCSFLTSYMIHMLVAARDLVVEQVPSIPYRVNLPCKAQVPGTQISTLNKTTVVFHTLQLYCGGVLWEAAPLRRH